VARQESYVAQKWASILLFCTISKHKQIALKSYWDSIDVMQARAQGKTKWRPNCWNLI